MGLFRPTRIAHGHCDLFCGVYDPAQAKIEAVAVLKIMEKHHASDDEHFKTRAIIIKEQRAEDVKHHLMVLWADFFTAEHRAEFPQLDDLVWRAIKGAGDAKKTLDTQVAKDLIALIDEIGAIFWKTEKAKGMGVYPPS